MRVDLVTIAEHNGVRRERPAPDHVVAFAAALEEALNEHKKQISRQRSTSERAAARSLDWSSVDWRVGTAHSQSAAADRR